MIDTRPASAFAKARKAPEGVQDFQRFKTHAYKAAQHDPDAVCLSFHRGRRNTNGRSVWLGKTGKFSVAVR
jgi:hypothetical protein